jgi:aspartate racemase
VLLTGSNQPTYGVIGGMGPLASAEFLKTIYECSLGQREQESPVVLVYSDPTFPDRTDAFLAGEDEALLQQLQHALARLRSWDASKIVICCMTIHYLVPRLSPELQSSIWSMLDVIAENIEPGEQKHLLICSNGTRQFKLFENHPRWELLRRQLIMPSDEDQMRIHRDLIYPIKTNPDLSTLFPLLETMLEKYNTGSFVAGCSEIHMLAKYFLARKDSNGYRCIDPLAIIAQRMAENLR